MVFSCEHDCYPGGHPLSCVFLLVSPTYDTATGPYQNLALKLYHEPLVCLTQVSLPADAGLDCQNCLDHHLHLQTGTRTTHTQRFFVVLFFFLLKMKCLPSYKSGWEPETRAVHFVVTTSWVTECEFIPDRVPMTDQRHQLSLESQGDCLGYLDCHL